MTDKNYYREFEQHLNAKAKKHGAVWLRPSNRKFKKWQVNYKGYIIHFGDNRYSDFLMTKNEEQRKNYNSRAEKNYDKDNNLTYTNKYSPNYWAYHMLWN